MDRDTYTYTGIDTNMFQTVTCGEYQSLPTLLMFSYLVLVWNLLVRVKFKVVLGITELAT